MKFGNKTGTIGIDGVTLCGGCGLKSPFPTYCLSETMCHPLRRVWIEIEVVTLLNQLIDVSPSAEGVD